MKSHPKILPDFGTLLLLLYFVTLLAGRFSPARLGPFPDLEVRSILTPLAAILTLLWLLIENHRSTGTGFYLLLFSGYTGFLAFSLSWSPIGVDIGQQFLNLLHLAAQVGGALAVASRLPTASLKRVWSWCVTSGLVYLVGGVILGDASRGRISAFGGGPNTFVRVMVLAAIGTLFASMIQRATLQSALLPLFLAGAVLSGSRGGLTAGVIAFGAGLIPLLRRMSTRLRRRLMLGGVTGGILVYVTIWDAVTRIYEQRIQRLTLDQRYDGIRQSLFESAVEVWRSEPIFGVGVGGFGALTGATYPHNITLASASEAGLLGVCLLVVLCAYGVRKSISSRFSPHGLASLMAFVAILVASQFSGDYYDSRFAWFFLGLAVIESRRRQVELQVAFSIVRDGTSNARFSAGRHK